MTAVASFGASERTLCWKFLTTAYKSRERPFPSEDLRISLTDGDFYAFSRGYAHDKERNYIEGLNNTHKHSVESKNKQGLQISIVMWGCTNPEDDLDSEEETLASGSDNQVTVQEF